MKEKQFDDNRDKGIQSNMLTAVSLCILIGGCGYYIITAVGKCILYLRNFGMMCTLLDRYKWGSL